MKLTNSEIQFGLVSVLFHWLFALAIIGLLASGVYMVTLSYYHPWYHPLPTYHKIFGIGTIILFILRTLWHLFHRQPAIESSKKWEIVAAKLTHKLMLLLSAGILITGYLIISVDVATIDWLGITLPSIAIGFDNQADLAGFWHKYLAYGLIGLIGLHVAATLKHQFIDKKKLIQKIVGIK